MTYLSLLLLNERLKILILFKSPGKAENEEYALETNQFNICL